MPNPLIELNHVERLYPLAKGQFFYVRDVNLKIEEGVFVSIMGPTGAGKSSLLHDLVMHDHARPGEYLLEENASAVLTAAVSLACWLPARRASGIDPITALRAE